jgi:hypothetical protein
MLATVLASPPLPSAQQEQAIHADESIHRDHIRRRTKSSTTAARNSARLEKRRKSWAQTAPSRELTKIVQSASSPDPLHPPDQARQQRIQEKAV